MSNDRLVVAQHFYNSVRPRVLSLLSNTRLAPRPKAAGPAGTVGLADTPPHGLMRQLILNRTDQCLKIQGLRKGVPCPEQPGLL